MDAIILAGGLGTRLQAAVSDVPKPLAPVNGRPFLDIILEQLNTFAAINRVVLAIGHKAELIQTHYQDCANFRFPIVFSTERTPMGTGGAICKALAHTESKDVLVLNGDSLVEFDLPSLVKKHSEHGATVTMVVTEVDDTARFGSVKLDAAGTKVSEFVEKGASTGRGFINAGCYLLARCAFETLPEHPSSFEKDLLPRYLSSTYALVVHGKFIDIGVPQSYYLAAEYLR